MQHLIVTDDLTGANDSATQFASFGLRAATAAVPFNSTLRSDAEVMVLYTESRVLSLVDAKKAVISGIDCIQSTPDEPVILNCKNLLALG